MKYKASKFNITVPMDNSDEIILFNTKECSFVVLDKETQGFLDNINEIKKYEEEVVSNLIELGFIVDKDVDEVEYVVQATKRERSSNESLSITIVNTLDCNMACYYCFEEKNKTYLSKAKADEIIEFISNRLLKNNYTKLLLTWTGGEPLLHKNIIDYISKPLVKICDENNIKYHATLLTNGLLMDEDSVKLLKKLKVNDAQITIDGMEDTHNSRRLSLEGYNSFKTILNNVSVATKYLPINIRINVDKKNKSEIKELLDYLYNNLDYKNNDNITVTINRVNKCKTSLSQEEFLEFYRYIYDYFMIDSKIEINYPAPLSFACGAQCRDSYVIDPEGYVYKCWEEIGIKEAAIGTIDRIDENCEQCQQFIKDFWPEECNDCKYLPMCHSGCLIRKRENEYKPSCNPITKILDKYLKKYYEFWREEVEE